MGLGRWAALLVVGLAGQLDAQERASPGSIIPRKGGEVSIYRDDFGVPHIFAATEEDGYFGLGYAQAEDQLESMLRGILGARGEAAAALGAAYVDADLAARQWLHVEEAKKGFARLSPELQKNYRGWVAGVTRYMADHPNETPAWAPRLDPWDPVVVSRSGLWLAYQAGAGLQDCQAGGVRLAAAFESALTDRARAASNEWVVAPWRTAARAPMLLSDPHGGIDGSWVYEFRLHAGSLDWAGYALGPMPILIHNRTVSWGMTTGAPDVADCYEIEVRPDQPRRYGYDTETRTMTTRDVTVPVKGGSPVVRTFEYARLNDGLAPIVARTGSKAYAVATSYMHDAGTFDEEVYRMARASTVGQVKTAMKSLGMFPQNVMVGDASGGSWYVRAGRTPKRPTGFNWNRPVSGNTARTAWLGIHPLEDLVQIENPTTGYMQNNNIAPDRMLEGSPLTADRYPSYIFNDTPGRTNSRGARAIEVLSRAYAFGVADAIELALDERVAGTEAWQEALRQAVNRTPEAMRQASAQFSRFVEGVLRFDGHSRAGSVDALRFLMWRDAMFSKPLPAATDDELTDVLLGKGEVSPALGQALIESARQALDSLSARYGRDEVRLGDVFRIGRGGFSWPLGGAGMLPPSGRPPRGDAPCARPLRCAGTLRAMQFGGPDSLGHRWVQAGSRMLRLVIFTDPVQSFTLHNFGQSDHPASPHYVDQARLSSERRLKPTYFNEADLLAHVSSRQTLSVAKP